MANELQKAADEQAQNPLQMIREGANLPQEDWNDARVAAVVKQFPEDFRRPENVIAFMERSVSSGLNPLKDELWAWENRGELQFMVSRDGWIKIADRDPKVTGLEFGHVYEGDEFRFEESGGHIEVTHRGTMKKGVLIGAYCVVHHEEGDHIERRLMEDFDHLNSPAWRDSPDTMALTRVISTAVRMKCPEAAGMHSQAEFAASDGGRTQRAAVSRQAAEQTEDEADALAAELEEEAEEEMPEPEPSEDGGREIEAEASEVEEGKAESKPSGTPSTTEATDSSESASESPPGSTEESTTDTSSSADDQPDETITCEICTQEVARSSYPGHKGGHSRSGYKLPDSVERVSKNQEDEGPPYIFIDEDGVVHEGALSWEKTVQKAQAWAEDPSSGAEQESGELDLAPEPEASETESEPSEDEEPEIPWDQAYSKVMMTARDHPDGLDFMRRTAQDVFDGRDVPRNDEGMVQTSNLSVLQLAELKSEMEEALDEAEF